MLVEQEEKRLLMANEKRLLMAQEKSLLMSSEKSLSAGNDKSLPVDNGKMLLDEREANYRLTLELSKQGHELKQKQEIIQRLEIEIQQLKNEGRGKVAHKCPQTSGADDKYVCVVCLEREKQVVALPCKHMCYCKQCMQEVTVNKKHSVCAICQQPVAQFMDIFL